MAKALRAAFQRFIQRALPLPVGSRQPSTAGREATGSGYLTGPRLAAVTNPLGHLYGSRLPGVPERFLGRLGAGDQAQKEREEGFDAARCCRHGGWPDIRGASRWRPGGPGRGWPGRRGWRGVGAGQARPTSELGPGRQRRFLGLLLSGDRVPRRPGGRSPAPRFLLPPEGLPEPSSCPQRPGQQHQGQHSATTRHQHPHSGRCGHYKRRPIGRPRQSDGPQGASAPSGNPQSKRAACGLPQLLRPPPMSQGRLNVQCGPVTARSR
jgi:hypothetical protein